jgi:hypothetical protein
MSDAVSPSVRIILQHWAYNITLLHNLGVSYPGFGYSEEEKQQLGQLAKGVTVSGHLGFGMLNALYFLFLAGLVMGYGAIPLAFLLDPSHQSAGVFFGCLGLGLALGIGLGIPTAMGLTALTLRWLGKEPQPTEVDAKTIVALYRKLHHQLMRAASRCRRADWPVCLVRNDPGGRPAAGVREAGGGDGDAVCAGAADPVGAATGRKEVLTGEDDALARARRRAALWGSGVTLARRLAGAGG